MVDVLILIVSISHISEDLFYHPYCRVHFEAKLNIMDVEEQNIEDLFEGNLVQF